MAGQSARSVEELILKKMASIRRWKKTKLYKAQSKWDFQFTIMTYNILSQNAVENHRYLYRNCHPAFLQDDYRISRILPEILKSKSDIICLQEVEQNLFNNRIKQVFDSQGFESIFKSRTGSHSDGCAILWRKKKFDLVHEKAVEFRSTSVELLDRDNIGLIAVLKPNHPKFTHLLLHVATTHLLFNPKRGDIKLCQLRWFFAELERLSLKKVTNVKRHYHPIILCGDFNIEPDSPLYEFIQKGGINVLNIMSGDLSGQSDGKNKGRLINGQSLLLHKLGISDASRFEEQETKIENPTTTHKASTSSKSSSDTRENFSPTSSDTKPVDPGLLAAIGSSNDSRWITTLLAMGNHQLAAELSSRLQANRMSPDWPDSADSSKSSDSGAKESVQHFYHDFKFVPVYKYKTLPKPFPITSMTGNDFNTVDHIFYSVSRKQDDLYREGSLRLLSFYSLISSKDAVELGGLPNAGLGSDHICLMAHFGLCNRK
ncbi:protein angel homolog 2 [Trichonephila clavata]|uniref:Protein angel homolog 2 n=1 Tax=Trichonephila clavata TaxID=2740835 RepID=A0A8X6KMJ4_TRICU|nr:protein angel homolog 2 [Trichonephila clavata]